MAVLFGLSRVRWLHERLTSLMGLLQGLSRQSRALYSRVPAGTSEEEVPPASCRGDDLVSTTRQAFIVRTALSGLLALLGQNALHDSSDTGDLRSENRLGLFSIFQRQPTDIGNLITCNSRLQSIFCTLSLYLRLTSRVTLKCLLFVWYRSHRSRRSMSGNHLSHPFTVGEGTGEILGPPSH